ncbi:acetylglutamate kinase [Listeria costaricensis]|uniref:acetylglutamate kinase n=1 Tax=Listeria costaricensis TaxID=2026604 RepID=UPI000C07C0BC|nr:acetylglutamate kinase [Listeria costaricensis]
MEDVIVIKIGGAASDALTENFFEKIRLWQENGKKIVLVHGGGHYISTMMQKLNLPIATHQGLRVTNKKALEVTRMVLIGQVQPTIMTKLKRNGFKAIGLSAADDGLLTAVPITEPAIGLVGEITRVKTELLENLLESDLMTVIAPLGMDAGGNWLNVNADMAACAIAGALHAERLYLLTDVPGVKIEGQVAAQLSTKRIATLIKQGIVTGGMEPKLKSASTALQQNVQAVYITDDLHHSGTRIKSEVHSL